MGMLTAGEPYISHFFGSGMANGSLQESFGTRTGDAVVTFRLSQVGTVRIPEEGFAK